MDVYIMALGQMINCMGAFIHPLLSLILIKKIGFSITEAGYFVSFMAIAQAPCIILGGKLVDTIGPRKVILYFQTIAALIFIVCGFIEPTHTLAYLLIAVSCFSSVSRSCYDAIVGNITTPENRQASFSLVYMGLNLGISIGPALGGFLFNKHLSILFIGDGITTLISIFLVMKFIKEDDYKGYVKERNELETEVKGSVLSVFKQRPILLFYSICMLTFQFAYAQWGFAIPIQLEELLGPEVGPRFFGILGSFNGLIVVLFTPLVTKLIRKRKVLSAISLGGLLYAVSFGVCGFAENMIYFVIIIFAVTIGEILISINSGTFIAGCTPASHRGRVNSILPLIYGMGYAWGPTIMGEMITRIGMAKAWIVVGIVTAIGAVIMYFLNYMKVVRD